MELPELWSIWKHKKGKLYQVRGYTNLATTNPSMYPKTVVYECVEFGKAWSRSVDNWHGSMTLVEAE